MVKGLVDNTTGTGLDPDYGETGSKSYDAVRGDNSVIGTDIMSQSDKDYLTALTELAKATPTAGTTKNTDYYPDDTSVVKAQMSMGTGLPTVNLFAPSALFPYAALDINESQQEAYKAAKENLYLQGLQYDYTNLKDSIKNEVWIPSQFNMYEEARKKYTDKYGEELGTKAFRMSNDYKMLTLKLNNYSKAFNRDYDEALKTIAEYQLQGKSTAKGVEAPEHYISESAFMAAYNFVHGFTKNVTLETLDELDQYTQDWQKAAGLRKVVLPYADVISESVVEGDYTLKSDLSTSKDNTYLSDKISGDTDTWMTTNADTLKSIYNRTYGSLPKANVPTYKEFTDELKANVVYKLEKNNLKTENDLYYAHEAYKQALEYGYKQKENLILAPVEPSREYVPDTLGIAELSSKDLTSVPENKRATLKISTGQVTSGFKGKDKTNIVNVEPETYYIDRYMERTLPDGSVKSYVVITDKNVEKGKVANTYTITAPEAALSSLKYLSQNKIVDFSDTNLDEEVGLATGKTKKSKTTSTGAIGTVATGGTSR